MMLANFVPFEEQRSFKGSITFVAGYTSHFSFTLYFMLLFPMPCQGTIFGIDCTAFFTCVGDLSTVLSNLVPSQSALEVENSVAFIARKTILHILPHCGRLKYTFCVLVGDSTSLG